MATMPQPPVGTTHPLDPLSAAEIEDAVAILREGPTLGQHGLSARTRIMAVALRESARSAIRAYRPGDQYEREAFLVLLDNADGKTYADRR